MEAGRSRSFDGLLKLPGVSCSHGGIIRADTAVYGLALERLPLTAPIWSMAGPPPLTANELSTLRSSQTIIDHHQQWLGRRTAEAPPAEVLHHLHRLREAQSTREDLRVRLGPRWTQLVIFGVRQMPWQEVLAFRRSYNTAAVRNLGTYHYVPQQFIDVHLQQLEEDEETERRLIAAANAFYAGHTDGQGWSWRSV